MSDSNHFRRAINCNHSNTSLREVSGIFAGAAAEVEYGLACSEQRIDMSPDCLALQAADGCIGPQAVIGRSQPVKCGGRAHASTSDRVRRRPRRALSVL